MQAVSRRVLLRNERTAGTRAGTGKEVMVPAEFPVQRRRQVAIRCSRSPPPSKSGPSVHP